jgi:hypothetical protein
MNFISFLSGALSSVIGSVLSSSISAIAPVLGMALDIIQKVANVAKEVLVSLGIIKPEQEMDDLGDRVIQAGEQGIKPENYEKFDDYAEALRTFELDPEKSKKIDEKDKLAGSLGFASAAIQDRFKGSDVGDIAQLWNLAAKMPEFFNADLIKSMLPSTQDFSSISDYFAGKLGREDKLEVSKTDTQILDTIDEAKAQYNKSGE